MLPTSDERNLQQNLCGRDHESEDKQQEEAVRKMEKPAVVLALRGSLSRYVKELERAGWRRLASGHGPCGPTRPD